MSCHPPEAKRASVVSEAGDHGDKVCAILAKFFQANCAWHAIGDVGHVLKRERGLSHSSQTLCCLSVLVMTQRVTI